MRKLIKKLVLSFGKDLTEAHEDFFSRRPSAALQAELHKRALQRSADFVEKHMGSALFCSDKFELLQLVSTRLNKGAILEFGVYKGHTINHLARLLPNRTITGFDSFEGLPENWNGYRYSIRNFDRKGNAPRVEKNVELEIGWFDKTLPAFLQKQSDTIALAHIDCDIYSSTMTVLQILLPHFTDGTILVFDEFFNYVGYEHHEYRAFFEFIKKTKLEYKYVAYSGQQVAVCLTKVP